MAPKLPSLTLLEDPLKNFTAFVEIDSLPVPIYKVEHTDDGRKTTCYIEAEEGKEFKVVFRKDPLFPHSVAAFLKLDGGDAGGYTIQSGANPAIYDGKRVSPTTVRPFVFSKLVTTDDADLATTDEQAVKNLGLIQLDLYRVQVLGTVPANDVYSETKSHVFDERSKKATLSHQAAFGAEKVKVDSSVRTRQHYIDPYGSPLITLEFKYRSRSLLELEDIVEAKPVIAAANPHLAPIASTSGESRKRTVISLSPDTDDELRAKVARLEAENAKLKRVKRESSTTGKSGSKFKQERQVISLLDDSD